MISIVVELTDITHICPLAMLFPESLLMVSVPLAYVYFVFIMGNISSVTMGFTIHEETFVNRAIHIYAYSHAFYMVRLFIPLTCIERTI
jgi:hypothetical protein